MCLRCDRATCRRSAAPVAARRLAAIRTQWPTLPAAAGGLSGYDGWELDEQLLHIQRVLQSGKGDCPDFRVNENRTAAFDAARRASAVRSAPGRSPLSARCRLEPTGQEAKDGPPATVDFRRLHMVCHVAWRHELSCAAAFC